MTKFLAASITLLALCACNSTGSLPKTVTHLGGSSSAGSAHPPVPSATPSSIPSSQPDEPAPAVLLQAPCQDFTGLYETAAEESYGGALEWTQDGCNGATLTHLRLQTGGEGYAVESVDSYPSGCAAGADHCNEIEISESAATLHASSIMAIANCLMPHRRVYELLSDGTLRITTYGGLSSTGVPSCNGSDSKPSRVEIAQRIGPRQ